MQSLFVLLRITIFEKGFPSLLSPTKTLFSAKYHMYQNEKFTTSPDAQPMTKFHICPKTKSTPLPAKPAEHPYPARLNRKFRHPASPAKGFRILPQAGKFPYFDLFPRPRILIPHRPTSTFIPPYPSGSSDIPPHPPKVSVFFPKPASSRISTCSPDRGSSFRTARPAPLFHLTRQEVPTSRLTRQRFPHSSPTKQVPVFRSGPKFPDCKKNTSIL